MRKNKLFAVIHIEDEKQAHRNAVVALNNGADGIFLINHRVSVLELIRSYRYVRERHKASWIGLNLLGFSLTQAVHNKRLGDSLPRDIQALWCDDVRYTEGLGPERAVYFADRLHFELQVATNHALLFGGYAFKYQEPVSDLVLGARLLAPHVGVITTSGPETGTPPTTEKIELIRKGMGDGAKLAVASGMTPENVDPFLDLVDYFLVATGISESFTELDPVRVRLMADKMRR